MKQLFPDAPENLAALGDELLTETLASFQDVSRRLKAGEIDLADHFDDDKMTDEDRSAEAMSQWRAAAEVVQEIRGVLAANAEAREAFASEAEEIDAAFGEVTEEAPVAEADEPEAELAAEAVETTEVEEVVVEEVVEEKQEVLVAAAVPAPPRRVLYPAVPKNHQARDSVSDERRSVLVAAGGQVDVRAGAELDALAFAQSMIDMARRRGPIQKVQGGGRERILLASADLPFPEDRYLHSGDPDGNAEKIRNIGSAFLGRDGMQALMAAGGICNPPQPFYDVPDVTTTARPVRDGLPGFRADRGAVSVPSVSGIGDITDAITVIEEEDDAAGGTFATKSCQDFDCATWTDVAVGAIAHCRTYGNLTSRSWPEGIAHENRNTMAAWARTAEGRLLDRIDSLSLKLTRGAVYGAVSTFIYALQVSRVGIISRLRMDPSTRFNVILPFWAAAMMSTDIVNNQEDYRFDYASEAIGALLSKYGFNAIWHLDEGLTGGADTEVWPDEVTNTGQDDWPGSTVIARVFPASQFLYLDGGSLELGLVRDSGLNHINNYEMFGESWENVARIGPVQAAHRLAITVCPDGTAAPTDGTAFVCSGS